MRCFFWHLNLKLSFSNAISTMIFPICYLVLSINQLVVFFFHGSSWQIVKHMNPDHICHIKRFAQRWWMCQYYTVYTVSDFHSSIEIHSTAATTTTTKIVAFSRNLKAWVCGKANDILIIEFTHTHTYTLWEIDREAGEQRARIQSERVNLI